MHGLGVLLAAWMQAAPVVAAAPSIEFHFTYEEVLQQGFVAATSRWAAQCLAGGEFAEVAKAYGPDRRMGVEERKAQIAKFDRNEFVRIATDAWSKANAALPQGPLPGRSTYAICNLPDCSALRFLPVNTRNGGNRIAWTPDGAGFIYVTGTPQNLWIEPLDGKPPRQLTHFTDDRQIADAAWSRDGTRLAIARTTQTSDIVLFRGLKR